MIFNSFTAAGIIQQLNACLQFFPCDLVLHMIKFYWVLLDITINLFVPLPFPGFTFLTGSCEYGTHITSWPASYIKFIYIKLALQLRAYSHYIENMYKADSQDEYI